MAQTRLTFLIILILLKIFSNGSCEQDQFNTFSSQIKKISDLSDAENSELSNQEESWQNNIEKRQLFFNENGENSPAVGERFSENNEYSNKRRNNLSEIENLNQFSDFPVNSNNQMDKNRFSLPIEPLTMMNNPEIPRRPAFIGQMQQNQEQDWKKKSKVIEKSESQWNKGSFQQFSNPYMNPGMEFNYNNNNNNDFNSRNGGMVNNGMDNYLNDRNRYNKKMSMTTFTDVDVGNMKNFNNERVQEHTSYVDHSMNHFNKNSNGYWNPNYYKPEKGVVINFNTDCPSQRQFDNQLVHKFVYSPSSPMISTQAAISSFRTPQTAMVSTHKVAPMCCF